MMGDKPYLKKNDHYNLKFVFQMRINNVI
jgi:hypothetical protein